MGSISRIAFVACALFVSSQARAIPEADYADGYDRLVRPFVASGELVSSLGERRKVLSGIAFHHPNARGSVVVLPGRGESWLKYGEVFYDLYQLGYSVFSYDHRGQGLSPHFVYENPQIGHVDEFKNYARDLDAFLKEVVVPRTSPDEKLFLLTHSMGGAIAADYLANFSSPFAAAVLSAPMFQIDTSPYPEPVARAIAAGGVLFGAGEAYAPGQVDYDPTATFETNEVTGSRARYEMSKGVVLLYPEIAMGGPSNRWITESIAATHRIRRGMDRVSIPMLVLQAGHDSLVRPRGQDVACQRAERCSRIHFAEAKHEILMETDFIRDRAFALVDQLFSGAW